MDGYVLKNLKPILAVLSVGILWTSGAQAQDRTTEEPLYRVTTDNDGIKEKEAQDDKSEVAGTESVEKVASVDLEMLNAAKVEPAAEPHPLDPALAFAEEKLLKLRNTIHDYEAIMIKQERVGGELLPAEYMTIKVRNERILDGKEQPFSIYLKFLRPSNFKGREVIFVDGKNEGNLIAHECGFMNIMRVSLKPTSALAMRGNRYPITDAGIENLVEKLIERGRRDRACGHCDVEFFENAKVLGRTCTMIQVKHDENKAPYDFHIGRIYIDDEHQVPIRYEAYTWPKEGETELPLLESYTYAKLKINVGLTDDDFNPDNENYDYP